VGRGRAGRFGGERAAGVGEDGPHGARVVDGGDDVQAAATAGAGEDIEIEHATHQRRPGPSERSAGGARAGLELVCVRVPAPGVPVRCKLLLSRV